jgi:hypothetical protein
VDCNGVTVDRIDGSGQAHYVHHYVDGIRIFTILMIKGEGINEEGENFTFSYQEKVNVPTQDFFTEHCNIKGEKGTLYNMSIIFDMNHGTYVIKHATCTGNTK